MSSSDQVAVTFTYKSIERICSDGGTQSWRMHQSHFGTFGYVICARTGVARMSRDRKSMALRSSSLECAISCLRPITMIRVSRVFSSG